MKHIPVFVLAFLVACAPADPPGTILPDAKNRVTLEKVRRGDSVPFRLNGGDMEVFISPDEVDLSTMRACAGRFTLIPYGGQEGVPIPTDGLTLEFVRMNSVKAGAYFVRTTAEMNFCGYALSFAPAR